MFGRTIQFALAFGFFIVASGCESGGGDGGGSGGGGSSDVRIPDTTKMLTSAEIDALENPGGDLSKLVFSASTSMLQDLASDDVLVCGVEGDKLPYGILRKVTSVESGDGKVTVNTEQATLTEAVEKGSINETFTLDASTITARRLPLRQRGSVRVTATQRTIGDNDSVAGLVFAINDYELYDADGDPATREDRVWLEGNFSFLPTIGFEIDIDGFSLQTLIFKVGSEQQASIRVTAGREATFDEVKTIESIELTPITFSIGPVPVVLVPRIDLRVGITGKVTAELTTGVQTDATVSIGFGYQNGSFGPTSEFDPTASFDAPFFRDGAKGEAKVWAGPRAELAAYGIAGVYGELRGFVKGEVDSTANPWWTLSAGVEAVAGAFIRVFDITIADYETDPVGASIKLADAGGAAPTDQQQVITWSRTFGGSEADDNTDNPIAIIETDDGGSLLVGGTQSFPGSTRAAWLIKLDPLGQVSWQVAFEDLSNAIGVAKHADGGYVVLTGVVGTGIDEIEVIHVDANGDVVWANRYEADTDIGGYGLLASGDDFVVGGVYGFGLSAQSWLMKIDGDGQVIWSKAVGGDEGDEINGFDVADDGSIVAVGPTHSFGVSFNGHWAFKLNGDGEMQWQKAYDGSGNEWAYSVVADDDGNFKIVGRVSGDGLVTKIDANGNLLASRIYDAESSYEEVFAGVGTDDGGLLIAGNTGLGDDADLWIMRLTPQLEVLWTTSYGGPDGDEAGGTIQYGAVSRPLAITADKGFLAISNTKSFGGNFYNMWVQKISETGVISYDAGSNASRLALGGNYEEYAIEVTTTNETVVDVAITTTPIEVETFSPNPVITTQAAP